MPLLIALAFALQIPTTPTIDATRLTFSPVRIVTEIDAGKIKGEPWRLAWSEDGKTLYLQTVERDKLGNLAGARHYLIALDTGKVTGADGEPSWATVYWSWKSGQTAPGAPAQRIDVEQRTETVRATAAPMGGELARGGTPGPGGGTAVGDAVNAAAQSQAVNVFALRWHGELIGEWANTAVVPGLTFGWAPVNRVALAYADKDGRLVVVDGHGGKQAVPLVAGALLPAWSADATRMAFLQRKDKKHFAVDVVEVAQR